MPKNSLLSLSLFLFCLFPFLSLFSLDLPFDLHCSAHLGRFLNSDTSRYYIDSSVNLYCTMLNHRNFNFFINYQDDLEVNGGNGVFFDPRYVHYYIAGGFDYFLSLFFFRLSYIHDCIHDIDFPSSDKPIFNRFRLQFGEKDFHYSLRTKTSRKFLWTFYSTLYAHWQYHGWDINAGADYNYDFALQLRINFLSKSNMGSELNPEFLFIKGKNTWYHQHFIKLLVYYKNFSHNRLGVGLLYNITKDPIRSPDKLWQFIIFFQS